MDPLKYLCEMRQDRGGMIQTSVSFNLLEHTGQKCAASIMIKGAYRLL